MKFSVVISVYKSETPEFFDLALDSLAKQTLQDFEIVLVVDGPIPDPLNAIVLKWEKIWGPRIKVVRLPKNLGIGGALNAGLQNASYEIIARMDSDDYSLPNRFQIQYDYMLNHPEIAVLGAQIGEFESEIEKIFMLRVVPETHEKISKIMWFKCPMNHVTVFFRRSAVLSVGGYNPAYGNDDFLWAAMRHAGFKFHNLKPVLVHVRVGNNMKEMIRRRATVELFRWNVKIRTYMFRRRMMNLWQYTVSMTVAVMVFLLPLDLKCYLFKKTRLQLKN